MKPSFLTSQVANGRDPFQVLEMPMRHDRHASWYYQPDEAPKGARVLSMKEYPQLHQANKDWVNKYNSEHADTKIEPNAFFNEAGGPFERENHHVVVADVTNAHTGEKIGFFNFAIGRWPHPSTPYVTGYINNVESHHSDVHDTENRYPGVMSGVLDHWANYLKGRGVKHFYANDDISAGLNPRKGSYWIGRMAPKHRDVNWGGLAKSWNTDTPHFSDLDHATQASVLKHKDMYKGWPGMSAYESVDESTYALGSEFTRWGWITPDGDGFKVHRGDTHPDASHHDELASSILGNAKYKKPKDWDSSYSKKMMDTPGVVRYVFHPTGDLNLEAGKSSLSARNAKRFMRSPYHTHPTLGAFGRQVKTVSFDSQGVGATFFKLDPKTAELKLGGFEQRLAMDEAVMYHGTPSEYVPSIMAVGLQPCSGDNKAEAGDTTPPSVSLTTSKKIAKDYAGDDGVVLKVDVPDHVVQHPDEFEKNSVKTHQAINPENIDVVEQLRQEFSEMFDADELEKLFGDTKEFDKPSGSTHGIHRTLINHGWKNVPASDPNHAVYQHPKHDGEIRVTDWEGKVVDPDEAGDTDVDISKELKPHGISTSGPLHVRMQSYPRGHWLHMYRGGGQGHEDLDTYLTHLDEPRPNPSKYMADILKNHGWQPRIKPPEILKSGYPAKVYKLGPNAPESMEWTHPDHPGNEIHLSNGSRFMPAGFEHRRDDLKGMALNGQNSYVSISSYLHNNARHGGFKLKYKQRGIE